MKIYLEPPKVRLLVQILRHLTWNIEDDVLGARQVTTRLSWAWEGTARDEILYEFMSLYRNWNNLLDELRFLLSRAEKEVEEWERIDRYYADMIRHLEK